MEGGRKRRGLLAALLLVAASFLILGPYSFSVWHGLFVSGPDDDGKGSLAKNDCETPFFLGDDVAFLDIQGFADKEFCLLSATHFHLQARFIGQIDFVNEKFAEITHEMHAGLFFLGDMESLDIIFDDNVTVIAPPREDHTVWVSPGIRVSVTRGNDVNLIKVVISEFIATSLTVKAWVAPTS